jgi:FKBP-type peptidyl-prolyl cis-trans isomerase SlyD
MRVAKDRVVAIDYTIRDVDGNLVESTVDAKPFMYLHGHDQIVPGIETALDGRTAGDRVEVDVEPAEAYGVHDPGAVVALPRRAFPDGEEPEVGDFFRAAGPDGAPHVFTVLDVSADQVVIDANHPLAGKPLQVRVEVISVRDATDAERRHEQVLDGTVDLTQLA